jgi:hypothetical protein
MAESHSSALTTTFVPIHASRRQREAIMTLRWIVAVIAIAVGGMLAGCSSADRPQSAVAPGTADPSGAPVALAPRKSAGQSIAMSVNQDELAKAVERLRITKKKKESPFDQAGADLNSDGRAKAVVLLTGQDWCSPQGCTLVIFEPSEVGYRPVSQVVGVRAPVAVGPGSNAGWRDLIVKTGASKVARLQFTGGGYPANAASQPDAGSDVEQSEVLIQLAPGPTAALPAPGTPPPQ